ncbi:MAG: hypothetical protein AABX95_02445 [Nanoarchaeota archaeon]
MKNKKEVNKEFRDFIRSSENTISIDEAIRQAKKKFPKLKNNN